MKYASLGRSGLIVSRVGLGTYTFGSGRDLLAAQSVTDQKMVDEIVHASLDAGVNFFNTANAYAGSQESLAEALGSRRRGVIVSTKIGLRMPRGEYGASSAFRTGGLSRRNLMGALDDSLRALKTDYIDVLIAHSPDEFTPIEEVLRAFDSAVQCGKIRYYGVSNWPAWQTALAMAGVTGCGEKPVMAEMYYSLAARDVEYDYFPMAEATGLGVVAWSPLSGGVLSGKYLNNKSASGRINVSNLTPVDDETADHIVRALLSVAGKHQATAAQVAIAWVLRSGRVSSALIGATTRAQLCENLEALTIALDDEDQQILEVASPLTERYPYSFLEKIKQISDRGFVDYCGPRPAISCGGFV